MIKTIFNVIMIKPINIIIVEQRESFKMFLYLSYNIKILTNIFYKYISNHVSTYDLAIMSEWLRR